MTAEITTVFAQDARADDIKTQIIAPPRQASLHIGGYAVIVGGRPGAEDEVAKLRLEATAMEAIAAHAQDVADQLLAWADQVEDDRSADAVLAETPA